MKKGKLILELKKEGLSKHFLMGKSKIRLGILRKRFMLIKSR